MTTMTLYENPVDQRFFDFCCYSVATGFAIASSVTGFMRREPTEYGPANFTTPIEHTPSGPSKFSSCRIPNQSLKLKPLRIQSHQWNRASFSHLSSTSSSLDICAAAFNPYAELETESKATPTVAPVKEKSKVALVDDGGDSVPPGDGGGKKYDGNDGGPPHGGGGEWWKGLLFESFRASLNLLSHRIEEKKTKEDEERQKEEKRMKEEEEWKKVD